MYNVHCTLYNYLIGQLTYQKIYYCIFFNLNIQIFSFRISSCNRFLKILRHGDSLGDAEDVGDDVLRGVAQLPQVTHYLGKKNTVAFFALPLSTYCNFPCGFLEGFPYMYSNLVSFVDIRLDAVGDHVLDEEGMGLVTHLHSKQHLRQDGYQVLILVTFEVQ